MARFEFKLPDIGEGVAEGEIVAWHVNVGDQVKEDQAMVEVMTDKATVTIGAPKKGTILETCATVGQVMPVGGLLVVIETEGAAVVAPAKPAPAQPPVAAKPAPAPVAPKAAPAPAAATAAAMQGTVASAKSEPAATAVGDIKDTLPGAGFFDKIATPSKSANGANGHAHAVVSERPLATPATRQLARELEVDLRFVTGTGPGGRITNEDVRGFAGGAPTRAIEAPSTPPPAAPVASAKGRAPIAITPPAGTEKALEERKPFVGMRRKIAERMQTSKNTAAHFTFVEECDVAKIKELRARLKPAAEKAGVKLTFLPFIVKAVVAALKKHPVLNSALDESTNELVYRKYFHIGIAASTDQGLMVPVVKDADRKSILEIAAEIDRLGAAAKSGSIQSADLQGSTFTITSLGTQGGLFATPVLNFPEVGILGVHQIKQKPVVRDDQIVIGEIMLLSLSFDHRIVDGHVGAAFAYDIIGYLEDPDRLFLEMA
ncbi:dihydrolipoamide acetyltransferase family protein [Sandaracinus amylolyticus]|uniref:Dihydrolipoamide acetyltransferase component of pyruvate dehydrogenase complex n=1 Tax=Sandaracinus amylolyticus TaxID=927083 RepID=A0A0F6YGB1_9BACT|nr:dihydrolipoamide acetyltransferase family protein [Sandaracinus amylolyticus]AKF03732.1 Dihydrolipoamide acyltransferase [Sandaracinus amylolyticus]